MQSKHFILFVCLFTNCVVFGQTAEYKKISLSVHAGMDFPIGTSNTAGMTPDFTLPLSRGFGATFDGTYFFAKNYGVGLKYHLFAAKGDGSELLRADKAVEYTFNETTHFVGPVVYGRWMLGTKWEIPVNFSVGYVHNKLSNNTERTFNRGMSKDINSERNDMTGNTVGVAMSAGMRYRITQSLGIGVYANGMFASAKKQKSNDFDGKPITVDVSRKMNRIGFSAGLDFNF